MSGRENYFVLLGLASDAAPAEIEARIRTVQAEWTSASTGGIQARRIKAKTNLEKLTDIRAVLLNAESRRAEAAAAAHLLEERRSQVNEALASHIDLLRASPFFTDAEVASSASALKLSPTVRS